MYAQYWGLAESPFQNTLDSRWFYESPGHEEALARLLYIVEEQRQCGVLLGGTGTGKSLILDRLQRDLSRTQREAALVNLQGRSVHELLWETAAALGLAPGRRELVGDLWRRLQDHLESNGFAQIPTVLMYDHLDGAEPECGRALVRLYHLGNGGPCKLKLVFTLRNESLTHWGGLLGDMSDLRIELPELDRSQAQDYVETLLRRAGANRVLFDQLAIDELFHQTQGIPRRINRLCDLCLLAGMADGETRVTQAMVSAAADEVQVQRRSHRGIPWSLPTG